jgi:5-methyltetrahydropteroyltriglutamate--homocysteine methyltransferase
MKEMELHRPVDEAAFDGAVTEAVADVVDMQVDAGIDIPGDGEMGRLGFSRYINQRMEGLEPREFEPDENLWGFPSPEKQLFPGFYEQHDKNFRFWWMNPEVPIDDLPNVPGTYERFRVTGPIRYRGQRAIKREIERLKLALEGHKVADAFLVATQPATGFRGDKGILEHYPSYEAFMYAMADACREEYQAIVDAGFILQVDYPLMVKPSWYALIKPDADQKELVGAAELGVEVLNHALEGIPEEKIRIHYCSGSGNTPHVLDAPLREIIAPLILKIRAQAYGVEGANPRHEHEWMVWRDIKFPDGKILIPGVIAHNYNVVEHPELVAWRLENYASVVGKENLIAGIDCGFSQHWDAARVHPEIQVAKLRALAEGAALASKKLWSRN